MSSRSPDLSPLALLRTLSDLISKNISILESTNVAVPDLDAPFHPESEGFRSLPDAAEAANIISAAALQLAAVLVPPQVTLYHAVGGHFKSAAIRACLESNVTEILREAGPKGLSVERIAAINGQDPQKLGRFLRILATNHVYREVEPDVFANNRISSMLDTLKPVKDILADPQHKQDRTFGLAALAGHQLRTPFACLFPRAADSDQHEMNSLDEAFKASAYSWETLSDPLTSLSGDPRASPFARSINSSETLWEFYERPEESYRQRRFDIGMRGIQALQPPDAILGAFDWKSLPSGSLVVDVGGGIGSAALSLATNIPAVKIVVQDLPNVVMNAKKFWAEKRPDALITGRVELEVHDFFAPQPETRKSASVYFLKQVLHDWSDEYCVKILSNLRDAAQATTTKLVLMESIMPFACRADIHGPEGAADTGVNGNANVSSIPGAVAHEAPLPLLANYGIVNEMGYNADIDMFLLFNSQERTIKHMVELLRSTGWEVVKVHRQSGGDSTFLQGIEAVPIA
ncbi:hypothetical protein ONZ45_g11654 [Pleurotus djamor]|nr:hypothetical protein ONZ45_g11654 [Pleurotus djamor]